MSYDAEQRHVIKVIKRIGRRRGEERVKIKSALMTGKVESDFRNLNYGDADSKGWRQERGSLYRNPTNLKASVNRYYDEADRLYRGQHSGALAADVQRPAAQYRGRYSQVAGEARRLLQGGLKGPGGSISTPGYKIKRTQFGDAPTTTTDTDGAIVDALLHRKGGSLLKAVTSNLDSGQFTTTTPGTADRTVTEQVGGASSGQVSGKAAKGYLGKVISRANAIDARKLPYVYGGGHGGKSGPLTPLDCSAAVSKALGINVRVSGEFMKWGKPGEGGKITVYANPTHVLVKINGHFWGTSAANPGGGAGWIPAGHITPGYLSKFTARHL